MSQAALTVEEILQLPIMKEAHVVSGERGLQNQVRYIDIMEIPDLAGWLRQNEFVLTTGYAFRDNPQMLCKLLDEMHKVGGAVVGVKQRRFGYDICEEAKLKSEAYAIPIIDIAPEITYIDITHTVMENILNRRLVVLSKVRDINKEFMQLILHRRGAEIVTMIGRLLHCEVAVLNQNSALLHKTPGFHREEVVLTREVHIGSSVIGYMQMTGEPNEDDLFAHMCIDQALTVLALEQAMQHTIQHRKDLAREDFLIELLSGAALAEDIIAHRAQKLDFPGGPYYYVLSIKPDTSEMASELRSDDSSKQGFLDSSTTWERIRATINESIASNGKLRPLAAIGGYFALLCATSRASSQVEGQYLAELLQEHLQGRHQGIAFAFGIGHIVKDLSRIHESYAQATHAVEAGLKVFSERSIIHYQDVYVEDLLCSVGQHPALTLLYNALLRPLFQYDQENRTELVKTLEALNRHGGNTKKVSEELFLHRNSVNYRLDRIQTILEVDIFEPEVRLRLDLLFRAYKLGLLPA